MLNQIIDLCVYGCVCIIFTGPKLYVPSIFMTNQQRLVVPIGDANRNGTITITTNSHCDQYRTAGLVCESKHS